MPVAVETVSIRKRPKQARSARMVDLLLEAAARVLEKRGLAGFNTNAVAERAGVSVGSLYQYFPNKEAMTAALILRSHREMARGMETLIQATAGQPLEHALAQVIENLVVQMTLRPDLSRVLEFEEDRLPRSEALGEAEAEIQRLNALFLAPYLDPALSDDQIKAAAFDVVSIVRGMLVSPLTLRGGVPAGLAENITRTVLGYLAPLLR